MIRLFAALCALMFASTMLADTIDTSATIYNTITEMPTEIQLPGGAVVLGGGYSQGVIVQDDGAQSMQYCANTGVKQDDDNNLGAGHCTVVYDNGDLLWVSFHSDGSGGPSTWTVIGGTGEWEGATGGGTTTFVSARGDGRSWTATSKGKIKTK
ncbi:MAG: hypothetical protein NXH85_08065 [Pseudomonadaceae bacterium]|nr:hypothetical protein [Pseudomonadaceae bacterium]